MSALDVDLDALATMATGLDSGAESLESAADSAPSAVDAGPMTGVISAVLAQVTDSAGNVSIAISAAAGIVLDCRSYYQRADADARAGLSDIQRTMESGS